MRYARRMGMPLTAQDIWPLVEKLSPAERVRLVAMASAMDTSESATDASRYSAAPARPGEFDADTSGLGWEAEGWDEFDPAR